jgi:hypothetical protein
MYTERHRVRLMSQTSAPSTTYYLGINVLDNCDRDCLVCMMAGVARAGLGIVVCFASGGHLCMMSNTCHAPGVLHVPLACCTKDYGKPCIIRNSEATQAMEHLSCSDIQTQTDQCDSL